eukprot:CAMPEP_0184988820 /NCGR_PEP_ID=MMETSP1098-20130426/25860_1 /TAXON_ID=89044 /ORGANISM="Spumella elongata, Strain CCAP 955/1" /LENGTH=229 /DNA_ID=CAMNT_0027513665 /DNA_START=1 /DNA_END=690 /DNA_ORIENTATION=+
MTPLGKFLSPYSLSALQRSFLIPYFGIGGIVTPERGDLVAGFGDVTGGLFLKNLQSKMKQSKEGQLLFKNKPLISEESLNLPRLRALPANIFGKQYASFMDHHGFSANERSKVRFMTNPDEAYTMTRYRQVHDFWHVLAGMPPSVLGEVALKCFEFRVTGLPVCFMGGLLGQLRLSGTDLHTLHTKYMPWALRAGGECGELMSYPYEENLDRDIDEVRKELRFEPAPQQ